MSHSSLFLKMDLTLLLLLPLLLSSFAHSTAAPFIKSVGSLSDAADAAVDKDSEQCVYTLYVRTGSAINGGTDSAIGVALGESGNGGGYGVQIKNLETWGGLMGKGHDYFERRNVDIFSGRGPCLKSPPCRMNLTSDGKGSLPGWFCDYVNVTATGPDLGCAQAAFDVDQWLAVDNAPHQLYAARDYCSFRGGRKGRADGGADEEE